MFHQVKNKSYVTTILTSNLKLILILFKYFLLNIYIYVLNRFLHRPVKYLCFQ